MNNILVSVIMSVFNESEKELISSIESIINQTYRNIEFIIIMDNPSNNKIIKILKSYEKKDDRVTVIINENNMGLALSLNRALYESKGEYIVRMDADDISDRHRIDIQLKYMIDNELDMVSSSCKCINENDEIIENEKCVLVNNDDIKKMLEICCHIIHPSVMIKRKCIIDLGMYRNFRTSQDYDLWLRFSQSEYKAGGMNEPLIKYRVRENRISNKNRLLQLLTTRYILTLYKERKIEGTDNFSEENFEKFLKQNGYYSKEYKDRFEKSDKLYSEGVSLYKEGKKVKGSLCLMYSIITNRDIRIFLCRVLKKKYYMNKLDRG